MTEGVTMEVEKSKPGFLLYYDQYPALKNLTKTQKGDLLDSLYTRNLCTKDDVVRMAYGFISSQIQRDDQHWERVKERRAQAGRLGGKAKAGKTKQSQAKVAKGSNAKQSQAMLSKPSIKVTDQVTVTGTGKVTGTVTDQVTVINNKKKKKGQKPAAAGPGEPGLGVDMPDIFTKPQNGGADAADKEIKKDEEKPGRTLSPGQQLVAFFAEKYLEQYKENYKAVWAKDTRHFNDILKVDPFDKVKNKIIVFYGDKFNWVGKRDIGSFICHYNKIGGSTLPSANPAAAMQDIKGMNLGGKK